MKIQGLAIIFIIIILPMSIILTVYTQGQITTLNMQASYDSKLISSTYDGIKAFQLNAQDTQTSDLINEKMSDINAATNTFFNSLASNFNMSGYGKNVLQNYVPAVVYTLYDGYYIYSPYTNTLDKDDEFKNNATYENNATINGLKPYIYYSCRYKDSPRIGDDFVITYSLDSYITIQGRVNEKQVNKSGYVLSNIEEKDGNIYYNDVKIEEESNLKETVYYKTVTSVIENDDGTLSEKYSSNIKFTPIDTKKVNGVKYYYDRSNPKQGVFSIINNKLQPCNNEIFTEKNNQASNFYRNAYEFKNYILNELKLGNLSTANATEEYYKNQKYNIFDGINEKNGNIEGKNSNFNRHKLEVIKHSIESNLSVAISNYNNISTASVNFQMPKLKEYEWEKILNNVSMITFLQGLNIGGKVYNGYAIVENNKTNEFVAEDSIYILTSDYVYHKATEENINLSDAVGIFNVNTERKKMPVKLDNGDINYEYFYPINALGSYNSIVYDNTKNHEDISEYVKKSNDTLKKLYYTALARERYSMYRVNNPFLENN